jgi:hypothetical protein
MHEVVRDLAHGQSLRRGLLSAFAAEALCPREWRRAIQALG